MESKRDRPTQKIGVVHQKIRRVICRDGCFHVLRPPENPKPQIQVHIAETGDHTITSKKGLSFADATEADVDELVASLSIVRCPRCQSPMFERTGNEAHNPDKLCSKCILADLNEQYEAAKKKAEVKQKKEDAKRKAEGYTHRINARIHPAAGGDDYQVVMYASRRPTKASMKVQLRKLGSEVFDDYLITKL